MLPFTLYKCTDTHEFFTTGCNPHSVVVTSYPSGTPFVLSGKVEATSIPLCHIDDIPSCPEYFI